ncbi:MAG: hypothetical protein LBS56_07060, partial [Propionibacteriaceae bacterium]|nr:hypothetical protein [Propionibacteriaceae bacterium]
MSTSVPPPNRSHAGFDVDDELIRAWKGDLAAMHGREDEAPASAIPGVPSALAVLVGLAAAFVIVNSIDPIRDIIAAAFLALNLVLVVWPVQRLLARFLPRFLASTIAGIIAIAILITLLT